MVMFGAQGFWFRVEGEPGVEAAAGNRRWALHLRVEGLSGRVRSCG